MLNLPQIEIYEKAIDKIRNSSSLSADDKIDVLNAIDGMMKEVVAFRSLQDSHVLHVNLMRGIPSKLSQAQLFHLAGAGECANKGKCLKKEAPAG